MFQLEVLSLSGEKMEAIHVSEGIFALDHRPDLIQRMVRWQLAKRRAGTHAVKTRAEISRTGKKLYKQKGTGGARHGSARVAQFRGGGRAFGPVVRSHAHALPKKVRALALRHALSEKLKEGQLIVLSEAKMEQPKTKELKSLLSRLNLSSVLVVDGAHVQENFSSAASNLPFVDVLPVQGINVYDIMRRKALVLTKAAIEALEARFK